MIGPRGFIPLGGPGLAEYPADPSLRNAKDLSYMLGALAATGRA